MRSVNKVILIGNLTRDPEMRQTPNGQQVCTFGIATNRQWVSKDGGKHSSAEFHELVAWARLAEICGQYLKKGKLIYIEGYLKTRAWDTPEGVRRHKTEVIVQDMIMLEKRSHDDEGGAPAVGNYDDYIDEGSPAPAEDAAPASTPASTTADVPPAAAAETSAPESIPEPHEDPTDVTDDSIEF